MFQVNNPPEAGGICLTHNHGTDRGRMLSGEEHFAWLDIVKMNLARHNERGVARNGSPTEKTVYSSQ